MTYPRSIIGREELEDELYKAAQLPPPMRRKERSAFFKPIRIMLSRNVLVKVKLEVGVGDSVVRGLSRILYRIYPEKQADTL